MPRYKWPESVPVLTATDIGYGKCQLPRQTLWDWLATIFDSDEYVEGSPRGDALNQIARKIRKYDSGAGVMTVCHNQPNRSRAKSITKSDIADIWNAAMRSLGYTEIEEVDDENV